MSVIIGFARVVVAAVAALALMASASSAQADSMADGNFALAPGDTLKFDILDDIKDPVDLPIATDGSIQVPYIGTVTVANLTVAEALEELSRVYVDKHIFVTPKLGLSVAAYRPIFVIGDARQPGSYPYQPHLTVEKALGLAGGQLAIDPTEDPILVRTRLKGQLETIEGRIIKEALAYGRLTAQLAARADIRDEDIPATAKDYMTGALASSVRGVESRIAEANLRSFETQKTTLSEDIAESERGLKLLDDLLANANDAVELAKSDLARAKELRKKGLSVQTDVSNIQRQVSAEQARQLQVLSNISTARRDVALLKSRLADLAHNSEVEALVELQTHNVELANAIAERSSAEEQLVLLSSLSAAELARNKEVTIDFTIRRGQLGSEVELPAKTTTMLAPGDVLLVTIKRGDDPKVASLPVAQP